MIGRRGPIDGRWMSQPRRSSSSSSFFVHISDHDEFGGEHDETFRRRLRSVERDDREMWQKQTNLRSLLWFQGCQRTQLVCSGSAPTLLFILLSSFFFRCPDCVKAEKPIEEALAASFPSDAVFIHCAVGSKERSVSPPPPSHLRVDAWSFVSSPCRFSWKDPTNRYRVDPTLRLTNIPTLVEWGTVSEQSSRLERLVSLFVRLEESFGGRGIVRSSDDFPSLRRELDATFSLVERKIKLD